MSKRSRRPRPSQAPSKRSSLLPSRSTRPSRVSKPPVVTAQIDDVAAALASAPVPQDVATITPPPPAMEEIVTSERDLARELATFLSPRSSRPPPPEPDETGSDETSSASTAEAEAPDTVASPRGSEDAHEPAQRLADADAPVRHDADDAEHGERWDSTPPPAVIDSEPPTSTPELVAETESDDDEEIRRSVPPPVRWGRALRVAAVLGAVVGVALLARVGVQHFRRPPAPVAAAAKPAPPRDEAPPAPAPAPVADEPEALAAPEDLATLKREALAALEHGKLDDAVDAAKRATELDAKDGQAWLLLGAAYQEKGRLDLARQCYATCAHQARFDAKGECAALVRSASLDYRSWPASVPRRKATAPSKAPGAE